MGKLLRTVVWLALVAFAIVGVARLVAVRWWQIPTDDAQLAASITPTLRAGDWVLSWRATPVRFGALVACPDPRDDTRVIIGRLVGEAGDQVDIDGARVVINGHPAETETACRRGTFHVADPSSGSDQVQHCSLEAMGGVLHMRGEVDGLGYPLKTSRTVGEGRVFLLSDNRAYSYDSRVYGTIDRSTCTESIFFRLVGVDGFDDSESRLTYVH